MHARVSCLLMSRVWRGGLVQSTGGRRGGCGAAPNSIPTPARQCSAREPPAQNGSYISRKHPRAKTTIALGQPQTMHI